MSWLSRKCGNLEVSQLYGPLQPVTGIHLPFLTVCCSDWRHCVICEAGMYIYINFMLQKVNMVGKKKNACPWQETGFQFSSWLAVICLVLRIKPDTCTILHIHFPTLCCFAVWHDFVLTHPQEVLPLKCVWPLVTEPQEGVKNEVPVRVVPPLRLPKQQQQSEGHRQPTIACSQVPAQLQTVSSNSCPCV
jgi:hypothetical protein